MNSQFLFENIFDLTAYPVRNPNFNFSADVPSPLQLGKPWIISGDLHGNVLRLLLAYVYHGALDMSPEEYDCCVRLYYTDIEKWGVDEIQTIEAISERAHKNIRKSINNLLIGDEVYDRRKLDYLNLLFIMFPVLFSNHGAEFICCFEQGCFDDFDEEKKKRLTDDPIYLDRYSPEQRRSALNLQKLIDKKVIAKEKVRKLIINNYLPNLKLVEFSVSANGKITVFTHAPSGNKLWYKLYNQFESALINSGDENKIKALREKLGIQEIKPYDPATFSLKEEIAKLKYLNELFNLIKEKRMIHQLLEKKYDADGKRLPNPLFDFIWNRERDQETLGRDHEHFNYGNGHDSHKNDTKGSYELDCINGKSAFNNEGQYNFLYSYEIFGNDIDDLLENKPFYQQAIESKWNKWNALQDEIIIAFSKEDFGIENIKISGDNFLKLILDPNYIFSDYRIHCLQYLLVNKKDEFIDLFKNNNKNFDKESIQSLKKVINNNEIHALLDILYELDTNKWFEPYEKMILQKLLQFAHHKQFLDKFYQILLLINEYRKHGIEIDINNIFDLAWMRARADKTADQEYNNSFITLYHIHLQENLLNSIKGCKEVDYLKLLTVYQEEKTLKNVCWIIKMIDLFCTDWKAPQQEKSDVLQKLVSFMCHPQFKETVFQEKINKLKDYLPLLPKEYLLHLFNYMKLGNEGIFYFNKFIDLISGLNFNNGWPNADRLSSVIYILNVYHGEVSDGALLNLLYADEERMMGFVKLLKLTINQKMLIQTPCPSVAVSPTSLFGQQPLNNNQDPVNKEQLIKKNKS